MIQYLKKLFSVGFMKFFSSFIPILTWMLIGVILDNPNVTNVFTITYPAQFIYIILINIFVYGNLVKNKKENQEDLNEFSCGVIIGFLVYLIIHIVCILNVDTLLRFMNVEVEVYKSFTIYALTYLLFNFLLYSYIYLCYYQNKDREAFLINIIYEIIRISSILIPCLIFKDKTIAILISISCLAIYMVILTCRYLKIKKFSFHIFKGIKFTAASIVNDGIMLLIYFVGFSRVFAYDVNYANAINLMNLTTDTQWDIEADALSVVYDISAANGSYHKDRRKIKMAASIFSIVVISSSILMALCLYQYYGIKLQYFLWPFAMELCCMFAYTHYKMKLSYINIQSPGKRNVLNMLIQKCLRYVVSISVIHPYALTIALAVGTLYHLVSWSLIYKSVLKKELRAANEI